MVLELFFRESGGGRECRCFDRELNNPKPKTLKS